MNEKTDDCLREKKTSDFPGSHLNKNDIIYLTFLFTLIIN